MSTGRARRQMLDDEFVLDMPALALRLGIDVRLIQNWLRRGHLERHGADEKGRVLVSCDRVVELCRARGVPVPTDW